MTRPAHTSRRSRAFTLVETMISVVIASFILAAITSTMLLASQAVPQRSAGMDRAVEAAAAVDRILTDLYYAKSVPRRDGRSFTLTVADRSGDGADETIRYAWPGSAGAALTYEINGSAAVDLLEDVREFSLSYDIASATHTATSTSESAEALLVDCDGGILDIAYAIDRTHWPAQYVRPTLPAGALSWRITRILYRSRSHGGTGGVTQVQVRPASSGNQPLNYVVDHVNVRESTLGSGWGWTEAPFSNGGPLDPARGACLVWQWGSDTHSADILYHTLSLSLPRNYLVTSSNAGSTWSGNNLQTACLYVYGTYSTANPPTVTTTYYLQRAQVTLRHGAEATSRVRGATGRLNAPQVAGP